MMIVWLYMYFLCTTGRLSLAVQSDDILWDDGGGSARGDVTGLSGRLHRLTTGKGWGGAI